MVVNGKTPVGAIPRPDFALYQGKTRVAVLTARKEPLSLGILVDTSGSMDLKLRYTEPLIAKLLEKLNPQDQVFLATFTRRMVLLHDCTTDRQTVIAEMEIFHPYGQTALYDGVIAGVRHLGKGCYPRTALVVISDGVDTASTSSLEDAKASAKQSGAQIFSVVAGLKASQLRGYNGNHMLLAGQIGQELDETPLVALAAATGAQTFLLASDSSGATSAVDALAAALDCRYKLGYVAIPNATGPLRVEITGHPGASAHIAK